MKKLRLPKKLQKISDIVSSGNYKCHIEHLTPIDSYYIFSNKNTEEIIVFNSYDVLDFEYRIGDNIFNLFNKKNI